MDFKEIGINMRNWVDSAQDIDYWRTLANAALNLRTSWAIQLVNMLAPVVQNQSHWIAHDGSWFTPRESEWVSTQHSKNLSSY